MSNMLFDALMDQHAGSARDCLILGDGTRINYDEIYRLSGRLANLLLAEGVSPGDRVAVQVEKSPQALALYLAAIRAGAVFLPLNTAYTPAEIAYFVEDSEPALVVCDPAREARRSEFRPQGKLLTLGADGTGSLMDAAAAYRDDHAPVARSGGDLAAILYTSGTTGRSKGAMLSHDNLLSNARTLVDAWRFSADDVLLHALPIFHTHGLFVASNVLMLAGGAMIWLPKFDAAQVVGLLPQASSMMGVPTFYTRLLDRDDFTRDLAAGIRLFTSGSAPLLAETHREFEARTGHRILERYGMTETNMSTSNPYEGERRAGTVGFPLPGVDLRITGEDGVELPQGEIGMIEVRGSNVFQGYWRMPEKTAEELGADGWFKTGDLGLIDADGYVTIVGRGKDLIISGGFNIYPKEVELLIDEMPGVLESAVIGVPHPDFGEGVVAIVARGRGAEPDPQAIIGGLADRLAKFKQPKKVIVVDELPRNAMGKVQKAELRARHEGLFAG